PHAAAPRRAPGGGLRDAGRALLAARPGLELHCERRGRQAMTKKKTDIARIATGVRNLDDLFFGGVPAGSVTVVGGSPGAGKTILTQQICFHNASAQRRVLYFSTLSEPTAKTLRYLSQFSFFDASKLDGG